MAVTLQLSCVMLPCGVDFFTEGKWDDDDFISIQHHARESAKDNNEYEYFEYTDEPKSVFSQSLNKDILVGKCRLRLPPQGGTFHVTYRRVFTSIAGKTMADVKPGEELKENDAVVTRQNKVVASSMPFLVAFPVRAMYVV